MNIVLNEQEMQRIRSHNFHRRLDSGLPLLLASEFNVMLTDLAAYQPERWLDDALRA